MVQGLWLTTEDPGLRFEESDFRVWGARFRV
jgi:hypothetical protein